MRKMFSYYKLMFKLNIQREIEHISGLASWGLISFLQIFANVFLIRILLDNFGSLASYKADQLIFMYGLSQISQGCMQFFLIQTWSIEEYVIEGLFDRMCLRPLPVLFQFLLGRVNFVGLFNVTGGIVAFSYGASRVGFVISVFNILQLIVIVISGTLIQGGLFLGFGCVAFFFKRTGGSTRILTNLCEKTSYYPVEIFPEWMQFLLLYILPYTYVAYLHSKNFFAGDGSFQIGVTLQGLCVGLLIFAVAILIFEVSMKYYESAGH